MARKQEAKDAESVGVSVRLPATLLANIDRLAVEERRTRGNLIRLLLEDALKSRAGDSDGK
jgi:metal-responsive CopG/Arc/MetJ family transcriptional regulator